MNIEEIMAAGLSGLLVGPPGCGKTAMVEAAAHAVGRQLRVMRASLLERVDVGGALVPDAEAGLAKALPLDLLYELQTTTEDTLLLLDDLGQGPMDVQAGLMKLFDPGVLSPHVLIWGCTNRQKDRAAVTGLCEPLRSRFNVAFEIPTFDSTEKPDGGVMLGTWADHLSNWCDWALDHDAPAEVVAWHRSTSGEHLYAWKPNSDPAIRMADFRAWETVIRLWNANLRSRHIVAGAIGHPAAAKFLAFAELASELPTPDEVWANPLGARVPESAQALYLVSTMLGSAATEKQVKPMLAYLDRMPRVYGALLAKDAYRRLGKKLTGTKEWVEWMTHNQDLFNVGG